jgi:hypothetical protein
LGNVIYVCCALPGMPKTVGYHFDQDGFFDLFGDKKIAFLHPLIAEFLVMSLFTLFAFAARRTRPFKGHTAEMHRRVVVATALLCDWVCISWACFFAHWTFCVVNQSRLQTLLPLIIGYICFGGFVIYFIFLLFTIYHRRTHAIRAIEPSDALDEPANDVSCDQT